MEVGHSCEGGQGIQGGLDGLCGKGGLGGDGGEGGHGGVGDQGGQDGHGGQGEFSHIITFFLKASLKTKERFLKSDLHLVAFASSELSFFAQIEWQ